MNCHISSVEVLVHRLSGLQIYWPSRFCLLDSKRYNHVDNSICRYLDPAITRCRHTKHYVSMYCRGVCSLRNLLSNFKIGSWCEESTFGLQPQQVLKELTAEHLFGELSFPALLGRHDAQAKAPTIDMPAAMRMCQDSFYHAITRGDSPPARTNRKADILSFFFITLFASSERKSSASRSTKAAYRSRPEELHRLAN